MKPLIKNVSDQKELRPVWKRNWVVWKKIAAGGKKNWLCGKQIAPRVKKKIAPRIKCCACGRSAVREQSAGGGQWRPLPEHAVDARGHGTSRSAGHGGRQVSVHGRQPVDVK